MTLEQAIDMIGCSLTAKQSDEIREAAQEQLAKLRAELAAANKRLSDIASAARQAMQQGDNGGSPVAALEYIYQTARIDAALAKGGDNG